MLVFTILFFILLMAGLYQISRNLLFPALLFVGTWTLTLIGILVSGDTLFEVSGVTYLVYIIGALFFSVGCIFGGAIKVGINKASSVNSSPQKSVLIYRVLDGLIIVLLIGLPFYWQKVLSTIDDVGIDNLFHSIRAKAVETSSEGNTFGLIGNFVVLSQFVAAAMFYEIDKSFDRRWRAFFAIVVALIYGGMTGTKGNMIVLLLTLFFIYSIKIKKIKIKVFLMTFGVVIATFSLGLLVINFAGASFSDTSEMIAGIVEAIQNYWLGGPVAFDYIVINPEVLESTRPISRFFLETANSLGMDVNVPSLHAEFSMISPILETNVYTIYFTYFKDFGLIGVAVIMLSLGAGLSVIYSNSMKGEPISVLFYSVMCVAIVMSIFAEKFFVDLNGYIKFIIFLVIIYKVIPFVGRSQLRLRVGDV
jgi:oligosaccharide repeat unit polymerase